MASTFVAPLDPPRRLLMGSGPSNAEVRVLQALAATPLPADDPAFEPVLHELADRLRLVFQASTDSAALAVPGASRAGLEAVLASVIEPGDRVMVGVYGHFGELLCTLAARHGAQVERVEAEWGTPVAANLLARRMREQGRQPPSLVAIVHADTSTGIVQPLEEIGAACRETGALLLVDAVLSIGGCEVAVDGWQIDAAVGGLQKCLGGPPGLALVTLSRRYLDALVVRHSPPQTAYLDLAQALHTWAAPHARTEMSTPMLMAAHEALGMVLDEALPARWRRHQRASQALRRGLDAMGLQRFGDAEHSVPMITLVQVPDGVDEAGVREQLLIEHGIEIMAAFGPLRGRVWRIGTMGTNAALPSVLAVLGGLEAVLASRGFAVVRGAAVDAAREAWAS
ncbi:MAG TPA: alanine--glyoxylate aminotransferase family protein [Chloroflexota bacterium]